MIEWAKEAGREDVAERLWDLQVTQSVDFARELLEFTHLKRKVCPPSNSADADPNANSNVDGMWQRHSIPEGLQRSVHRKTNTLANLIG